MIKMQTTTYYNGKTYQHGDECTVDPATEKRWVKNGIAESMEQSKFSTMSDQELTEYAEQIGVDISRSRTRESAEAKVRKFEQENV